MIHELKTWPEYFQAILKGTKKFEVRKNDRDFKEGDTLILIEGDFKESGEKDTDLIWIPTGRKMARTVTSILYGGKFGIEKGYCVMSIG